MKNCRGGTSLQVYLGKSAHMFLHTIGKDCVHRRPRSPRPDLLYRMPVQSIKPRQFTSNNIVKIIKSTQQL